MKTYLAKTFAGLEPILQQELHELGATHIQPLKRSVSFKGDQELLYRANLQLRTALRILVPFRTFRARREEELYRQIKRIDWSKHLDVRKTFAIDPVVRSRFFRHSKYAALKAKDAIADQFRERFDRRPSVNVGAPHLLVNLHIHDDQVTVSFDSSVDSLHMRRYRRETLDAPVNEVLAAGMILMTGWRGDTPFIDPMCGSGTLLAEAAMIASRTPPSMLRERFGFKKWKNFDEALWQKVVASAKSKIRTPPHPILGFDKDFKAVRIAERNLDTANMIDFVTVQRSKFEKLIPPTDKGILITNPPYDERLQSDDINNLYAMIGERLKHHFSGFEAWLISSNKEAIKQIGLRPSKKIPLYNGALECRFLKFELYEGSKKTKSTKTDT